MESDANGFRERSPWTNGHRYITSLSVFKKQISLIKKYFCILPTSELIDRLNNGIQEKESIAAIHFDDGFKSYMDLALPVMKKERVPSTVFLIYDVINGKVPIRNKIAYCLNTSIRNEFIKKLSSMQIETTNKNMNYRV